MQKLIAVHSSPEDQFTVGDAGGHLHIVRLEKAKPTN
jgi:hypothetical protein